MNRLPHKLFAALLLCKFSLSALFVGGQVGHAMAKNDIDNPLKSPIEISVDDKTLTLSLGQLGVKTKDNPVETAFKNIQQLNENFFGSIFFFNGKKREIAQRAAEELATENLENYTWNTAKSESILRRLFELPRAENASFALGEDGHLTLNPQASGVEFDTDAFLTEIVSDTPYFKDYTLETWSSEPLTQEELAPLFTPYENLLKNGLRFTVGEQSFSFPIQNKELYITREEGSASIQLDPNSQSSILASLEGMVNVEKEDMVIKSVADITKASRVELQGHLRNGLKLNREETAIALKTALSHGQTEVAAVVEVTEGQLLNESGQDLGPLNLLGRGVSNFEGSGSGRIFNVRKAIRDHVNGILIPPDTEFSFNSILGPVTYSAGWQGALAIFSGGELRTVPGGGICQSSTTFYRALLGAGLPITRQKAHSLYVHYYSNPSTLKNYGVEGDGLDATIFPGSQDLKFFNDTGNYILVEAYDQDFDAVVNLYGQSDGRSVTLSGPFTTSNQTDEVIAALGKLSRHQIAWKQVITKADGSEETNWRVSTYKETVKQY